MIHDMVFDPTELRTLGVVFDEAWELLRSQHDSTGSPELRLRLASPARVSGASVGEGPPAGTRPDFSDGSSAVDGPRSGVGRYRLIAQAIPNGVP